MPKRPSDKEGLDNALGIEDQMTLSASEFHAAQSTAPPGTRLL